MIAQAGEREFDAEADEDGPGDALEPEGDAFEKAFDPATGQDGGQEGKP
jgi:hypothetical protein